MESVTWLNDLVGALWPYIGAAAEKIVRDTVEPQIQAKVPGVISGIHFERFSLGKTPPRIENVQTVRRQSDSLELQLDIVYDGDSDIYIAIPHMGGVGVAKFILKGRLGVLLKPLIGQVPVIAAAQAFFANPPTIDMDFKGAANLADWPVIAKTVRSVLHSQIGGMLVLPNRFTVKLVKPEQAPGLDIFASLYEPPRGVLRLTVMEAKQIKASDTRLFHSDTSDAYCVVSMGSTEFTTRTIEKNLSPVWMERNDFVVSAHSQVISASLYDEDVGGDDFLGRCEIPVRELLQQEGDVWLPLTEGEGGIHLNGTWLKLECEDPALAEGLAAGGGSDACALLVILVDAAANIPVDKEEVFVRVHVGDRTFETKKVELQQTVKVQKETFGGDVVNHTVVQPNPHPEFEMAFEVLLVNPAAERVTMEIIPKEGPPLGTWSYAVGDLLQQPQFAVSDNFPLENAPGTDAKLKAKLQLYALRPGAPNIAEVEADIVTGCESAEWISNMMGQMWPWINLAAQKIVKEDVEPLIQSKVPGFMSGIHFERFTLGEVPPKVGNFKVETRQGESVELSLELDYDGDMDVSIKMGPISFGVARIKFAARFGVLMQPLVPVVPVVGAVQAYCVNPPRLEIDFTGLANVADWPVIAKTLRRIVLEQICGMLVLPNRMAVKLCKDISSFALIYQPPEGILRLTVAEAKELKASDKRAFKSDTSDGYCEVRLGTQFVHTKTVKNSLCPVWGETFDLLVTSTDQEVAMKVYDDDTVSADDLLGTTAVPVRDLVAQGDLWTPLDDGGAVHLVSEWMPVSPEASLLESLVEVPDRTTAVLAILVDEAANLPTEGLKSAFVRVTIGNEVRETKPKELHVVQPSEKPKSDKPRTLPRPPPPSSPVPRGGDMLKKPSSLPGPMPTPQAAGAPARPPTRQEVTGETPEITVPNPNPDWEQAFEIPLTQPKSLPPIKFEVFDDKKKLLGHTTCDPTALYSKPNLKIQETPELQDAVQPGSRLCYHLAMFVCRPA